MQPTFTLAAQAGGPHHLLLVGTRPGYDTLPPALRATAEAAAAQRGFTGARGELLLLAHEGGQWLLCGLGDVAELTPPAYAEALGKAFAELRKAGASSFSLHLPEPSPWDAEHTARRTAEALYLGAYSFRTYKTTGKAPVDSAVELVSPAQPALLDAGLRAARAMAEGLWLTRDLVNHPAAVATPDFVTTHAREVAEATGAKVTVIRGEELKEQGYGSIYAVGRAAETPPALVKLEWGEPAPGRPTIALVGKGVTFDTGGLDLKGASGMALMKKDMGGAATVLGASRAIASLGLPVHLVTVLCLAENAVDSRAFRPGDVLHSKKGLTIEVTNTDAEGRLVLADGFALALESKPHYMIDFATLTGACRVALGPKLMGLFCDDPGLREAMLAAGEQTGDGLWPLPLYAPYREKLDSAVADLANAASDGMGGAITAALFLKEFAGSVAWAHVDCYAWSAEDNPLFPKGGSGVGVRLLVDLMPRLIADHATRSSA